MSGTNGTVEIEHARRRWLLTRTENLKISVVPKRCCSVYPRLAMLWNPPWLHVLREEPRRVFSWPKAYHFLRGETASVFARSSMHFWSARDCRLRKILSAERIARVFAKHGGRFGLYGVYTTSITVWSFLSQVLRDGKEASCQSAVARVVSYCKQQGISAPTRDTGDYCRARSKLSAAALRELSREVAEELEQAADESWLWKHKHPPQADRWLHDDHARYAEESSQVSAIEITEARSGTADCAGRGHPVVGDGLRDGPGDGAVQGQRDGRAGLIAIAAAAVWPQVTSP